MIFLITPANRHIFASELQGIFRLRHEVLVEGLGWHGLQTANGLETDEFDNEYAVYLGMKDATGAVVGCMRLNPSDTPTLSAKHFAHMVQFAGLPSTPNAYDVTRHLVARSWQHSLRESLRGLDLFCGLVEFGLAEDVDVFTALIPVNFFWALRQIGVGMEALGYPGSIEGEECLIVQGEVTAQSLLALYRATRNSDPRLQLNHRQRAPVQRPAPQPTHAY